MLPESISNGMRVQVDRGYAAGETKGDILRLCKVNAINKKYYRN